MKKPSSNLGLEVAVTIRMTFVMSRKLMFGMF